MGRQLTLAICVLLRFALPALAILGVGDIVFDPNNFQQALQAFAQLQAQYQELVQTYGMIQNQYQEMLRMAQNLPNSVTSRYRTPSTPWTSSSAADAYGNTAPWIAGINSALDVSGAYSAATQKLGSYGSAWDQVPAEERDDIKTNYATVELSDGANVTAIQLLGQIRSNASAVESALANLQNDSLSDDPRLNTEVAVLNKINAAHLIALSNQQATNQLLASLVENRLIESKRQRDVEAQAFNDHIRFMNEAQTIMSAQSADASTAMLAWRMP